MMTRGRKHRRRGTILIVTMLLCFTLAAVVLVLCHSMSVEAVASANESAGVQADAIERGAEQYFLGMLVNAKTTYNSTYTIMDPTTYDDSYWDGVQLGKGYFWLLRPDFGDSSMPMFGPIDECGKLELNKATFEQLQVLPGMTDDLAAALNDWWSTANQNTGGAKSDYYQSLPTPYQCKEAPYDTVDETLMVRGMTKQILYGLPDAPFLGQSSTADQFGTGPSFTDTGALPHGLADLLTVYSYNSATGNASSKGLINVNTAPPAVLKAILINGGVIDSSIIDTAVAARQSNAAYGLQDTTWATGAGIQAGNRNSPNFTSGSQAFSADILAVAGNGRAFKRVKIVILTGSAITQSQSGNSTPTISTAPQIVYRRDFTHQGWPLDPAILDQIRSGTYQPTGAVYADATSSGGATH